MADFEQYLKPGKRGHLIGAGGVSMAPLAEVLAGMGLVIDGSDMAESEKTRYLRSLGIDIKIGHSAMNVAPDIQFVVRTAAVHDDNPEIVEARARGVPIFERAQAWGAIMRDYDNALCIAGTHGKTTTTSMCTHILMAAERDPTVMIGGTLPLLHAGHRVGGGDTIILESCEYHDSFLYFRPTIAVILDIEADHLDYFSGLEDVKRSFREFASKVPEHGRIVANIDDRNTMDALAPLGRELFTFGLTEKADVYARNIPPRVGANSEFDIYCHGKLFTSVTLHIPACTMLRTLLAATAASSASACAKCCEIRPRRLQRRGAPVRVQGQV
ncbi:MAG: Mur ligase domain-containing protein [Oscillospiraceae bacterium]